MSNPKISVIIPIYNAEKYLRECIDSVINQTLKEIEIICINDGSTDDSLKILKEYEQKDKRIKLLSQKNQGAGKARNLGLEVAKGEYFAFIDADDFYDNDFCKQMYTKANVTNADVVICQAIGYDTLNNKYYSMPWSLVKEYLPSKEIFNYKDIKNYIFIFSQNWNWNKLFKKEFIDKNNITFQNLFRTNDLLFTCKALIQANKITTIKNELVNYRTGFSTNSQSTNYLYPYDFYKAFKALREWLISIDKYEEVKQSYVNWALGGLVYNIDSIGINSIKKRCGKFIYNKGLKNLGLTTLYYKKIYKQVDYEKFIKQYYKFNKKIFGFEKSKYHYFLYLFGLQILIKRRWIHD